MFLMTNEKNDLCYPFLSGAVVSVRILAILKKSSSVDPDKTTSKSSLIRVCSVSHSISTISDVSPNYHSRL